MEYFPPVDVIKSRSFVDTFFYQIQHDLFKLVSTKYYGCCINSWIDTDLDFIQGFLQGKGYITGIRIGGYKDTNTCSKPGCLVYHTPKYEPQRFLYICLYEHDLPEDKPEPIKLGNNAYLNT